MKFKNVDINGGFEGGVSHDTLLGEFDNIVVPAGWTAWWRTGRDVPWDPANNDGFGRPEAKVIARRAPFLDPPRIRAGDKAFQMFGFWRIFEGGLLRTVDVSHADAAEFSIWAHAWTSNKDDPHVSSGVEDQMAFRLGIDRSGGRDPFSDRVLWSDWVPIYDTYDKIIMDDWGKNTQYITLFVAARAKYRLKHNDAYFDDARLRVATYDPPKRKYSRTYLVVPANVPEGAGLRKLSRAEWLRAAEWAYDHDLTTLGNSMDDAMGGSNVDDVRVLLGYPTPDSWSDVGGRDAIEDFRDLYYPKANITGEIRLYDDDTPNPPSTEVPAEAWRPALSTNNYIGLHFSELNTLDAAGPAYIGGDAPPTVIKTIIAGELVKAAQLVRPHHKNSVLRVLRRYVGEDPEWVNVDDPKASANAFLDLYDAELVAAVRGLNRGDDNYGIDTVDDMLEWIDVFESVNEVGGTYDAETPRLVEFDIELMRAAEQRYGGRIKIGALTYPIGNPAMDEVVSQLMPAIEVAEAGGHYLATHHAYWGTRRQGERWCGTIPGEERAPAALENGGWHWAMLEDGVWAHQRGPRPTALPDIEVCFTDGLERHFPWMAGRWMVWDDISRERGLYPLYYCGEGGALATPGDCGPGTLGGGTGWRGAGEFDPFILDQLRRLNRRYAAWNAIFGNRFLGMAYFTSPWFGGWKDYIIGSGEIEVLRRKLLT